MLNTSAKKFPLCVKRGILSPENFILNALEENNISNPRRIQYMIYGALCNFYINGVRYDVAIITKNLEGQKINIRNSSSNDMIILTVIL